MKRAFTLVEMLVVVVVIAILTSVMFRVLGVGSEEEKRNKTVMRLQRLENCIAGYYAVYGCYPPVGLQGRSRDIYYEINGYKIQQTSKQPKRELDWKRVEAACRAQPVKMEFPFSKDQAPYIEAVSDLMKKMAAENPGLFDCPAVKYGFDALENPHRLDGKNRDNGRTWDGKPIRASDWTNIQLFNFGLMSYLLPRYLIMMGHSNRDIYDDFSQWSVNNTLPCRPDNGVPYQSWRELNQDFSNEADRWKVALIPSQAVTARWLANLQEMLCCESDHVVYGVSLKSREEIDGQDFSAGNTGLTPYTSGDSQSDSGGGSQQYGLDQISCKDGWKNELYYYSPPPYQGYRLWSAGRNKRTFPPWITDEAIEQDPVLKGSRQAIYNAISDDIVHMGTGH